MNLFGPLLGVILRIVGWAVLTTNVSPSITMS
jgi:hypothetical protein